MPNDHTARRDFLRISGASLAGAALPSRPAEAQTPHPAPNSAIFDVRFFGATGDGKTIDTPAINRAIEAAAAAGGGTVRFPAGNYLCYSIRLKSNLALSLDQNAVIIAAQPAGEPVANPADSSSGSGTYDLSRAQHSLGRLPGLRPQPLAQQSDLGRGPRRHLHHRPRSASGARASAAAAGPRRPMRRAPRRRQQSHRAQELPQRHASATSPSSRAATSASSLTGVDNLTIDNLTIDTDRDGMDIDCCRNVRVSNCTVNSPWDDAICPKSSASRSATRAPPKTSPSPTATSPAATSSARCSTAPSSISPPTHSVTAHRPHQVRHRVERRLQEHHHLQLRLRRLPGPRARNRRRRPLEDITITNITMRDIVTAPHLPAPRQPPARPARRSPSRHPAPRPDQQPRQLQRRIARLAPSSAASPATPSKTSSSPTSTSSTTAAAPPKPRRFSRRKTEDKYPEPEHVRPTCPRTASSFAT